MENWIQISSWTTIHSSGKEQNNFRNSSRPKLYSTKAKSEPRKENKFFKHILIRASGSEDLDIKKTSRNVNLCLPLELSEILPFSVARFYFDKILKLSSPEPRILFVIFPKSGRKYFFFLLYLKDSVNNNQCQNSKNICNFHHF